jgi:tetratricopeptide (TPR) repeat protein
MPQNFLQLEKRNPSPPADQSHGPPAQQQVLIEGRILIERTAFVGHSFLTEDREVIEFFKSLLTEMAIRPTSGERAEAKLVSQKVKDRIAAAEMFVGILTRREQIEQNPELWRTSDWLIEEKTHAAALGKKVIVLKERGVEYKGGLLGDEEYVEFDRAQLHEAGIRLIQMIWSLNPGKMTFGKSGPPQLSVDILEAAVAAQPREPMLRVQLAQIRIQSGKIDAALRELSAVIAEFPQLMAARLEITKALQVAGRIEEAEQNACSLIAVSPFDAAIHHQLAHVLENQGKVQEALEAFARAQDCEPGNATHYLCHGKLQFRSAGENRHSLTAAKKNIETGIQIGGPDSRTPQIMGFLAAISRKMMKPPLSKAAFRRKNKRPRR